MWRLCGKFRRLNRCPKAAIGGVWGRSHPSLNAFLFWAPAPQCEEKSIKNTKKKIYIYIYIYKYIYIYIYLFFFPAHLHIYYMPTSIALRMHIKADRKKNRYLVLCFHKCQLFQPLHKLQTFAGPKAWKHAAHKYRLI